VKLKELTKVIQQLLPAQAQPDHLSVSLETDAKPTIFIIDDDDGIRAVIRSILEEKNWAVEDYATGEDFLKAYSPGRKGCILIDVSLPGMTGLDLLARLNRQDNKLPAIIITGHSDVPMAVQAMKGGASDFIEKPISQEELVASIQRALEQSEDSGKLLAHRETAARNLAGLTSRQLQIMELVLAGHPSKNIATDLGISQRTVENHRAVIMKKTGAKSLPALARLALTASLSE
jgi:two-component system CheB/CheR fusion protein